MVKTSYVLGLIFAVVLASRLFFAFSTPNFIGDKSYFNLRQAEQIMATGKPLFEDDLSYSARTFVFSPVFHYVLAFFSSFLPLSFVGKLVPNVFASIAVFLVYGISYKITGKRGISFFTAFFSGFVPVFFASTFNSVFVLSLAIPLILLLIYSYININKSSWFYCYFIVLLVASFTSPFILLFCISLVLNLFIVFAEKMKISREELEVSLSSIFFILWSQFILYKKFILFHGIAVIWQNIPNEILSEYFYKLSIPEAVYQIGVMPTVFGAYIIYKYLFREKRKEVLFLISFAIVAGILLWLKLTEFVAGTVFLGLVLIILFSQFYCRLLAFLEKTKASKHRLVFSTALIIIFFLTAVYPSFAIAHKNLESSLTGEEVTALLWIKQNALENAVILSTPGEGNYIAYFSERRRVIDTNFLLRSNAEEIFNDVKRIFTTKLELEAIDLMEKYGIDYIYFSSRAKREYGLDSLSYINEDSCIDWVYSNEEVSIFYRPPACEVRVLE